jgi:hypothetical protein
MAGLRETPGSTAPTLGAGALPVPQRTGLSREGPWLNTARLRSSSSGRSSRSLWGAESPRALAKRHGISRNMIEPSTMPAWT